MTFTFVIIPSHDKPFQFNVAKSINKFVKQCPDTERNINTCVVEQLSKGSLNDEGAYWVSKVACDNKVNVTPIE